MIAGEGPGNTQVVVGGTSYDATPVYFDPSFDFAVLRTTAPLGPVLTVSSSLVPNGTQAAILGYPEDGPLTEDPASVTEEVTAHDGRVRIGGEDLIPFAEEVDQVATRPAPGVDNAGAWRDAPSH